MLDDEETGASTAQEHADFDSGFAGDDTKPAAPVTPVATDPAATPPAPAAPAPKYVRITETEWQEVRAAAAKSASHDQQLSRAFGTIGNLQTTLTELRAKAAQSGKFEIPKDAFDEMAKDFPELATMTRSSLERALSGFMPGTGDGAQLDETVIERMLAEHSGKREVAALVDMYPDWREIVGAVDIKKEQPDPKNPFRTWLATKDAAFQTRVNSSASAAVIGRAIDTFQRETKAPPKPGTTHADTRRAVIAAAVQPRGDGSAPAAGKTDQDEFEAGYTAR